MLVHCLGYTRNEVGEPRVSTNITPSGVKRLQLQALRTLNSITSALPALLSSVSSFLYPKQQSANLSAAMTRGYKEIPNVNLTLKIRACCRQKKYWGIILILFSEWPLGLNILTYLIHPQWAAIRGRAMIWFAGFGLSVALMLIAAMKTWTFATERGNLLDELTTSAPHKLDVAAWMDRSMAHYRQLLLPVIGAIGGPIYLYMVKKQLEHLVAISGPSYLLIGWVGFVGGIDLYWLWVATGVPKRLYTCGDLELRWQDPASTPGLRLLSDAYGISALFLLAGVAAISVLGFVLPSDLASPGALYLLLTFFAVAMCTSIRVAIIPFFWIWRIVVASKRSSMKLVDAKLPSLQQAINSGGPIIDNWTAIYQAISVAPTLPFSTATMVQYGAAMVGSIFAFFFGLATHLKI